MIGYIEYSFRCAYIRFRSHFATYSIVYNIYDDDVRVTVSDSKYKNVFVYVFTDRTCDQ